MNLVNKSVFTFLVVLAGVAAAQKTEDPSKYFISPKMAYSKLNSEDVIFLDVGAFIHFRQRHAVGSKSFSILRLKELEESYPNKNATYFLISSWKDYSDRSFQDFRNMGYKNVFVVQPSKDDARHGYGGTATWEKQNLPIKKDKHLKVNGNLYKLQHYGVFKKNGNPWQKTASFARPTVCLLETYRPEVRRHFYLDEEKDLLFNAVEDVVSTIVTSIQADNKIWVGFSFYEGEGWEGYGGIGFFDTSTREMGVLRHPALVNCSVQSLKVTKDKIYVATIANYELSSGVCNGLVVIDLMTSEAKTLKPPGPSLLKHKDGGENVLQYYDKPIVEMISDPRFVESDVENFTSEVRDQIQQMSLEQFMIEEYKREKQKREQAVANARLVKNETVMVDSSSNWYGIKEARDRLFMEITKSPYLHKKYFLNISISDKFFFYSDSSFVTDRRKVLAVRGSSFEYQTTKHLFKIVLEDFETSTIFNQHTKKKMQLFLWAKLNVKVYEIRD